MGTPHCAVSTSRSLFRTTTGRLNMNQATERQIHVTGASLRGQFNVRRPSTRY